MEALESWLWNFVNDPTINVPTLITYVELALQRAYAFWPRLQVFMDKVVLKPKRTGRSQRPQKPIPVFVTRLQWSEYHQVLANFKDPSTFVPSLQFL